MWHFKLVNWGNYPRVKQVGALWQDTLSPVVKDTCLRKFTSISKFGQVFKVSDISQKNTSPFSVFYHQLWALSIICVYYSDKERLPGSYHLLAISEMPPFVLFDCITTTHTAQASFWTSTMQQNKFHSPWLTCSAGTNTSDWERFLWLFCIFMSDFYNPIKFN